MSSIYTEPVSALGTVVSSIVNGVIHITFGILAPWIGDIGTIATNTLGYIGITLGSVTANLVSWAPLAVSRLDAMFQPMTEGIKATKEVVNAESSSEE